jgi:ATP/ADP translocase
MLAIVNIGAAAVVLALVARRDHFEFDQLLPIIITAFLLAFALFGLFMLQIATRRFRTITNALEKYDDYQSDF